MRFRIGTGGFSYKQRRAVAVLIAAAVLGACSPAYKRLPTLTDVPELEALVRDNEHRQQRLWNLPVGTADDVPYSIVAEETGSNREDELVVLIHGLASDRTTWQFVSGHLGKTRRLWIPDQLGCGESDRPDPEIVGESAYSPTESARHLLEALRQRNEIAGWPDRIVIVGHSLGGAVALRMLGSPELRRDYPRVVGRIDRAVLIAPLGFAVHRADTTLSVMSRVGGFMVFLGRSTGVLKQNVAKELLQSAERPEWVFKFDADRLIDAFVGKRNRRATQAIIRQAVPFDLETRRPDWPEIERLVADYRQVDVPVLLIWGDRDETLPLAVGYKLAAELPNARLHIVEHGKHSLQADRPGEVADMIDAFLPD
jgi:pimeloyl-ACP methyl ester carboxylesterase